MDGLIIFSEENAHPLAWLLNRRFRHVWCALRDEDRGVWVSFNGHQGIPIVQVEAGADFDLATYYEEQGYKVIRVQRGTEPSYSPLVLNNCVGYVKVVMAIKCWSVTPYGLYRHLTKESAPMKRLFTVPGFGGSTPAPPPPPPPPPEPPKKADAAVRQARSDEIRRQRQRAGMGGTNVTGGTGLTSTAATAQKTLLGN